jgi:hypothetical protein
MERDEILKMKPEWVWERWSVTTRTRADDHMLLRAVGFPVPDGGPVGLMVGDVVAYTNPALHCGDGKVFGDAEDLIEDGMCPHTYAIRRISRVPKSLRVCRIGGLIKTWNYESFTPGEWRSNVGDVETTEGAEVILAWRSKMFRLADHLEAPLLAVDFVDGYAVDLNTSPGLKWCPGLPSWREVAELIAAECERWR